MKKEKVLLHREDLEAMPSEVLEQMLKAELDKEEIRDALVLQLSETLEARNGPLCSRTPAPSKDTGKSGPGHWLRAAAIAVVAFLTLGFAVPEVLGAENIFELIGRWTKNIFVFAQPEDTTTLEEFAFCTDNPDLQQLYDTVKALGGPEEVVPTWMPEGYELVEIRTVNMTDGTRMAAVWDNGLDQIVYSIYVYTNRDLVRLHKNETEVDTYEMFGVLYYITGNTYNNIAAWATENAECSITANERSVLLDMIHSIYEERWS